MTFYDVFDCTARVGYAARRVPTKLLAVMLCRLFSLATRRFHDYLPSC